MELYQIILLILFFAGAAFLIKKYIIGDFTEKDIWRDLAAGIGHPKSHAMFKYDYTTPGGVRVRSTVEVRSNALALLDEGITNQIMRHNAEYPTWDKYKSLSDYDLLFVDPTAQNVVNEPGSPAIMVQGIQSAGTCIGVWPHSAAKKPYIVLPHQAATHWRYTDYLMRSAWHESEHVREYVNDYGRFLAYVGAGDRHPHIP